MDSVIVGGFIVAAISTLLVVPLLLGLVIDLKAPSTAAWAGPSLNLASQSNATAPIPAKAER